MTNMMIARLREINTGPLSRLLERLFGATLGQIWDRLVVNAQILVFRLSPRKPDRRDILFYASCSMMADYLNDVWEILKDDSRLRFYLLADGGEKKKNDWPQTLRSLPMKVVSVDYAEKRPWDMVLTSYHEGLAQDLIGVDKNPGVFIPHGIAAGVKYVGEEEDYPFSRLALDENNRSRYARIFAASDFIRDKGVMQTPALQECATAVGDPHNERMLALVERRDEIREQMGIRPEEKVVLVCSAWTPKCLYKTMGDSILAEGRKLLDDYRIILNCHPHLYHPWAKADDGRIWGEYIGSQKPLGFMVREPDEDWAPFMVACDVLLTDYTSLALHGILLGRPAVYIPIPDDFLVEGSLVWRYRELSPALKPDASNLGECLEKALNDYPADRLRELATDVNSYPGQSFKLMRKELYDVLQLPYHD